MKTLKQLLSEKTVVCPGAHDALTARIISTLGFDSVFMSGYGQSASHLGMPDVGLMTMSEMVERAANIVEASQIPVVADGDTGYGNAINVIRTIREYEKAGVSAIQLEDQVMPKKCGHMLGREVVSVDEMVGKIKAAVDARRSDDFLIIARTDARTSNGIDDAIARGLKYKEAGADIIAIESPESVEEMKLINAAIPGWTMANMIEGGRTPQLCNRELAEIGYNMIIYSTSTLYTAALAIINMLMALKHDDTTKNARNSMLSFADFNKLIGIDEISREEAAYCALSQLA